MSKQLEVIDIAPGVRCSSDYRFFLHHGKEFAFEDLESGVVEALVENFRTTGFMTLRNRDIEEYCFPPSMRGCKSPRDVFRRNRNKGKQRMHPAWGVMIGPGDAKGTTKLILSKPVT